MNMLGRWTQAEVDQLFALKTNHTTLEISGILGRSVDAINHKIKYRGATATTSSKALLRRKIEEAVLQGGNLREMARVNGFPYSLVRAVHRKLSACRDIEPITQNRDDEYADACRKQGGFPAAGLDKNGKAVWTWMWAGDGRSPAQQADLDAWRNLGKPKHVNPVGRFTDGSLRGNAQAVDN